jgi:hypothetical protein
VLCFYTTHIVAVRYQLDLHILIYFYERRLELHAASISDIIENRLGLLDKQFQSPLMFLSLLCYLLRLQTLLVYIYKDCQ